MKMPAVNYANVAATLALVLASSGGAYALSVPNNSVGTAQIKDNAVTKPKMADNAIATAEVKNGSLQLADFATGQLLRWRGSWAATTTYAAKDAVQFQG